jgi:hypothetical protein
LGVALVVLALGVVAAYIFGDQQRTGRLLSEYLTRGLGVPVQIDRVVTRSDRLTLRGVRVLPGASWGGALEIRDIQVDGGLIPFVFPAGRHLSFRVGSTTVTLSDRAAPIAAPAAEEVAKMRQAILQVLQWPLTAALDLPKGELRSGTERLGFTLKGEKKSDAQASMKLGLRFPQGKSSEMNLRGSLTSGAVMLALQVDGSAMLVQSFWPAAFSLPERFTAQAALRLLPTPLVEAMGTFTAARSDGSSPPLTGRLEASYRPDEQRLTLGKLELVRAADLTLTARGSVEDIRSSPRLMIEISGKVGEGRIESVLRAGANSRSLQAEFTVTPVSLESWGSALGWVRQGEGYSARAANGKGVVNLSLSSDWTIERMHANTQLQAFTLHLKDRPCQEVKVPALALEAVVHPGRPDEMRMTEWKVRAAKVESQLFGVPATMGIVGETRVRLLGGAFERMEDVDVFLTNLQGGSVGHLVARPASKTPHVWSVVFTLPDLGQLPPLFSWRGSLKGSATAEGLVTWQSSAPTVQGLLSLELPRGEIERQGISISGVLARAPFRYGGDEEMAPGKLEVGRLQVAGLIFERVKADVRFVDGKLSFNPVMYSHYGGEGEGWLQAEVGSAGWGGQFRFDGRAIELSRLVASYQLKGTKISGNANYLVVGRREASGSIEAGGRVTVGEPGGVASTDLLKQLLSYAEADPSGVVRATLENLSDFPYKSLTAEARTVGQEVRLSLSILGKERFGIFPPKVKAINIQNLPLSFLLKAVATSTERR